MKEISRYLFKFMIGIFLVFALHLSVLYSLGRDIFENEIIFSYIINTTVALIILLGLLKAPSFLKNSLGFLFLGGSLLKFMVFFLVIYPVYKSDGQMDKWEFSTFFIPYAANLIFETKMLIDKLSQEK